MGGTDLVRWPGLEEGEEGLELALFHFGGVIAAGGLKSGDH